MRKLRHSEKGNACEKINEMAVIAESCKGVEDSMSDSSPHAKPTEICKDVGDWPGWRGLNSLNQTLKSKCVRF